MKNYNVAEITNLVANAKSALVVVPTLSVDGLGSALALGLALKKQGKQVKFFVLKNLIRIIKSLVVWSFSWTIIQIPI